MLSTAKTCPTVQSSNKAVSDCANECSSDDDCQYDRICCSNECGGRTCSDSVEMCQVTCMSTTFMYMLQCSNLVRCSCIIIDEVMKYT